MRRSVGAHLELELYDTADLVLSLAVAAGADLVSESLLVTSGGATLTPTEVAGPHGTRLHRLTGGAGVVSVDYRAEVVGRATAPPVEEIDLLQYRRPSRYCESDTLLPTATAEFAGLSGKNLLDAVSSWVGDRLTYVPGASLPTDGAVATLLARRGVCRDYAHLVIALLRALDVPSRLVSVYAPGLSPMDFHAVAEAYIDGAWYVVDATTLAPRGSLLRIATGQDASGTAFLSQYWSGVDLWELEVTAVVDELSGDDLTELVQLG